MKFKNKETMEEFDLIKERLKVVLDDLDHYFQDHGHELIITDLISSEGEDAVLKRVSPSHRQGRAADIRTRNLPKSFIYQVAEYFNEKYREWAAISKRTLEPTLVVYHDGSAYHLHVQVRPYEGK